MSMQKSLISRIAKLEIVEKMPKDIAVSLKRELIHWVHDNVDVRYKSPTQFIRPYDLLRFVMHIYLSGHREYLDYMRYYIYLDDTCSMRMPWFLYVDEDMGGICEKINWQRNGHGTNKSLTIVVPFNESQSNEVWLENGTRFNNHRLYEILNNWEITYKPIRTQEEEEFNLIKESFLFRGYQNIPRFSTPN